MWRLLLHLYLVKESTFFVLYMHAYMWTFALGVRLQTDLLEKSYVSKPENVYIKFDIYNIVNLFVANLFVVVKWANEFLVCLGFPNEDYPDNLFVIGLSYYFRILAILLVIPLNGSVWKALLYEK